MHFTVTLLPIHTLSMITLHSPSPVTSLSVHGTPSLLLLRSSEVTGLSDLGRRWRILQCNLDLRRTGSWCLCTSGCPDSSSCIQICWCSGTLLQEGNDRNSLEVSVPHQFWCVLVLVGWVKLIKWKQDIIVDILGHKVNSFFLILFVQWC